VSDNRSTYSHVFFVEAPRSSRYTVYLRHATIFVLADAGAASTWRPSEGDRCSGRWYELLVNNRRWGLVLNHCRAMLLAPGPPLAPRLASEPWPSYLSSSTGCALQQFGAWSSCHGSYPALWAFSTKAWGVVAVLFTAYHGAAAPTDWPLLCSHRRR
jgi:hypothetical protein